MMWWEKRADIYSRDRGLVEKYYPALIFKTNKYRLSLEGTLVLKTSSGIPKTAKINILFPSDYPKSALRAFEVDNQFGGPNPERHINKDKSFCLYFPLKANFDFDHQHTIIDFIDVLLVFLKKQFIYERTGKWPGKEEPHAFEAYEKYYYEMYHGSDSPETRALLKKYWAINQKIGRNDRCPCGNGSKYKKCHLNYLERIKGEVRRFNFGKRV